MMKRVKVVMMVAGSLLAVAADGFGAFGLATATDYYQVDTGAGLVFKVRRTDNGSSTQSPGDIMSLVYDGTEYQNQSKGSHINSGFDYLGYSNSTVNVTAEVVNTNYIKITVTTANLIHYYIARNGYPHIYMATWFDVQPVSGGGLCRYIVRMPYSNLPNGPEPSDLTGTTYTVESGDIFGMPNGITRSKHYSNHRLIDWSYTGATGNGVGVFMVRDSQEGGSGGPFYRSLINQGGGDQEITYIINYGQTQTEAFRTEVLNGLYVLVFTDGHQPDPNIDTSWVDSAGLNLIDWVPASGRGAVAGAVAGVPDGFDNVVGFANAQAQYWTRIGADGSYVSPPMIPGTYTATVYKQEMGVATDSVVVSAGSTTTLNMASSESDPAIIWRLGDRDGTPNGFMNADKATWMHPSDVRMDDWNLGTYVVGSSLPATGIPCYQWKDIAGGSQTIQFELTAAQVVDTTVNIGITVAHEGGRPNIEVNGTWTSPSQGPSAQPDTRSLTTGTYRGNNALYTFSVPSSALHAGVNTLRFYPISGTTSYGFLSPGYSIDYIEWRGTPSALPGAPSGVSMETSDTQVNLEWDPVPSAIRYIVERAGVVDGPYAILSDNVGPAHFTDTSATNGVNWFYRVSAVNALGEGNSTDAAATASHLVTRFRFDETSGTTALDSVGGQDGTLMSGASWTSGTDSNAVQLDGTSSGYVELPDGLVEDLTDCTIATWVYATATPTWSRIFDFGMGTESYMMLTPNSGDSTVRFAITIASAGGEQPLNSGSPLSLNGWHHVAVTLSGNTGKLYIDGSIADTQTITLDPADLGLTRQNYIGKSQWPTDLYPTAKVDDFRIYGRALSDSEVATMASQTPPSAPSDLTASAITNRVTLNWPASSGAATYNLLRATTNGGPYTLIAGGIAGTSYTHMSAQSGVYHYVVTAVSLAGESGPSPEAELLVVKIPGQPVAPASPIAYYRFEEGTASTDVPFGANAVTDSAGGGNDNMNAFSAVAAPTYMASVPASPVPQTGSGNALSLDFDGNDDLYNALSGPLTTTVFTDFTVEAYVKFSSLSGYQTIVGRDDSWNQTGGQDGNLQALFYLTKHPDNHIRVEVSTVGGDLRAVEGSLHTTAGTWNHVAAVGDASAGTLTLYVNGQLAGSVAGFDGLFDPLENNAWTIGRGQFNGYVADNVVGQIDEVRFCNAALSPEQFLNASNAVEDDSDLDGLSDVFETYYFGNLDQTGAGDPDDDGDDNQAEQLAGTSPTISSIPPVIGIHVTGALMSLDWPANRTGWMLEVRTNMVDDLWVTIPNTETNNTYQIDLSATPLDSAFFRLVYP